MMIRFVATFKKYGVDFSIGPLSNEEQERDSMVFSDTERAHPDDVSFNAELDRRSPGRIGFGPV